MEKNGAKSDNCSCSWPTNTNLFFVFGLLTCPLMKISLTESSSHRICLNHSSYAATEGTSQSFLQVNYEKSLRFKVNVQKCSDIGLWASLMNLYDKLYEKSMYLWIMCSRVTLDSMVRWILDCRRLFTWCGLRSALSFWFSLAYFWLQWNLSTFSVINKEMSFLGAFIGERLRLICPKAV